MYSKKFDTVYIVPPSLKTAKSDPFECLHEDHGLWRFVGGEFSDGFMMVRDVK